MSFKFFSLTLMMLPVGALAQSDDFGTILSVEAEHKVNKQFSVGVEVEMRTRDDVKTMDRWSAGVDASYRLTSWLKASAGYTFIYDNNEKYSYYDEDDVEVTKGILDVGTLKRSAEYWGCRHRFQFSLTGSYKLGKFDFSLRERAQYTYKPERTIDHRTVYFDENEEEYMAEGFSDGISHTYKSKNKMVLRSRLQVEYKTKGFPITPYASVELFNGMDLQKIRYTAGYDYKISKRHSMGLYYRYQHVNSDDDNEVNRHYVGLSYQVKF